MSFFSLVFQIIAIKKLASNDINVDSECTVTLENLTKAISAAKKSTASKMAKSVRFIESPRPSTSAGKYANDDYVRRRFHRRHSSSESSYSSDESVGRYRRHHRRYRSPSSSSDSSYYRSRHDNRRGRSHRRSRSRHQRSRGHRSRSRDCYHRDHHRDHHRDRRTSPIEEYSPNLCAKIPIVPAKRGRSSSIYYDAVPSPIVPAKRGRSMSMCQNRGILRSNGKNEIVVLSKNVVFYLRTVVFIIRLSLFTFNIQNLMMFNKCHGFRIRHHSRFSVKIRRTHRRN